MMTVEHTTSTSSLSERLAAAHVVARRSGEQVLVSHSEPLAPPDPLAVFTRARQVAATRIYWASPRNALVLVGIGAAREFTASGPDRFAAIAAAWQHLLSTVESADEGPGFGGSGTGAESREVGSGQFAMLME